MVSVASAVAECCCVELKCLVVSLLLVSLVMLFLWPPLPLLTHW